MLIFTGGIFAGSLAIVSDAAHLLTDFASFLISLLALYLASRKATKKLSFGWYRAGNIDRMKIEVNGCTTFYSQVYKGNLVGCFGFNGPLTVFQSILGWLQERRRKKRKIDEKIECPNNPLLLQAQ